MCMLLGFSGAKRYELNKIVKEFFSYSKNNPHGWGLALYNVNQETPIIIKEGAAAHLSLLANNITNNTLPGKIAIAHIRYATYGKPSYLNSHPFIQNVRGKEWVLAHNGSIKFPKSINTIRPAYGNTDSEKVLCYIGDELKKLKGEINLSEEIRCIEQAIIKIARYGKLNLLISDGENLFVHTNYKDSLYMYKADGAVCFVTKPLSKTIKSTDYISVPMNKLLVYKDGEKIYEGKSHSHEYIKEKFMTSAS